MNWNEWKLLKNECKNMKSDPDERWKSSVIDNEALVSTTWSCKKIEISILCTYLPSIGRFLRIKLITSLFSPLPYRYSYVHILPI
jgi:hypothetical protein